ncbi:MAG: hypothetical protein R6V35_03345 [Candidatus Nanohaloarchaea archaeon]
MNPINDPLNFGDDDIENPPGKTTGDIKYPTPDREYPVTDGGVQSDPSQISGIEESLTPEEVPIEDLLEMLPEEQRRLQDKKGYTPRGLMKAAENALEHSFYTADQTVSGTNYSIRQLAQDSSAERAHDALEKLRREYFDRFDLSIDREDTVIEMPFYRPKE